jgi:ABC-type dipeptide/oligopeptide/nickel transport system ATPase component
MQKRVMERLLLLEPRLLIADETTTAMDGTA